MSRPISSINHSQRTLVAMNRVKARTGGLGFLAAQDYLKSTTPSLSLAQHPDETPVEKAPFIDPNAEKIQKAREKMIEMGLIKPVKEVMT